MTFYDEFKAGLEKMIALEDRNNRIRKALLSDEQRLRDIAEGFESFQTGDTITLDELKAEFGFK